MKTKKTEMKHRDKNGNTWNEAVAKGALVWGTVYSTASSGAAYLLAPVVAGTHPAFSDIFMDSLVIFPTAGAAKGLAYWQATRTREKEDVTLELYTSKGRKKSKRPLRVNSKAA
jgi:hypothetical protein